MPLTGLIWGAPLSVQARIHRRPTEGNGGEKGKRRRAAGGATRVSVLRDFVVWLWALRAMATEMECLCCQGSDIFFSAVPGRHGGHRKSLHNGHGSLSSSHSPCSGDIFPRPQNKLEETANSRGAKRSVIQQVSRPHFFFNHDWDLLTCTVSYVRYLFIIAHVNNWTLFTSLL